MNIVNGAHEYNSELLFMAKDQSSVKDSGSIAVVEPVFFTGMPWDK